MNSRRSMPKVRSGCSTCKIRRVKCDEQKPNCARCIRAGRECKGYPTPEKSSHLHDGGVSLNIPIKAYSIPFKVPGSRTDRQLLHFYCSNAAGNLGGFSDKELWTRLILQRCHDQSIIRNAVVTLSSLYLDHVRGEYYYADIGWSPPAKSLEQITRCHRQLMTHLGSPNASLETALICSLFFYTFETILGNKQQALFHLDQGIVLLKRYQVEKDHRSASEELCTHLTSQFSRLDLQASRCTPTRTPLLNLVSHPEISGTVSVVPDTFFSPTHAEAILTKLENWMVHQMMAHAMYGPVENVPLQAIYEKDVLVGQIKKYCVAIDKLVHYCRSQDPSWTNHTLMLQIASRVFYTALTQKTPTSDFESPYPNREEFEKSLKDTISDTDRLLSSFNEPSQFADQRYFSLSSTFISLITYVIIKTTNRDTLEKALSLLKHDRLPSRENLADSKAMGFVFRKLQSQLLQEHIRSDDDQYFDTNLENLGANLICRPNCFYEMFSDMLSEEGESEL